MTKTVVYVKFTFDTNGSKEQIKKSIHHQIQSDMNIYWQNDDDSAQMTELEFISTKFLKED